jgi:hypothetical protein
MLAIEPRSLRSAEEKLAAIGIRSSISLNMMIERVRYIISSIHHYQQN